MSVTVLAGDNREVLLGLPDNSVDAVVTDAPYGLGEAPSVTQLHEILTSWMAGRDWEPKRKGFMGAEWDGFVPGPQVWAECFRVLKPGGHLLVFFGTRTVDIGGLAVRLAGFEIRDLIAWLYGSGFPKSLNVSKAIDATLIAGSSRTTDLRRMAMGADYEPSGRGRINFDHGAASAMNGTVDVRVAATEEAAEWQGWGTALKPALEPIVLARKPLAGTVAANVLAHGTGALNIDASRVGYLSEADKRLETRGIHVGGAYESAAGPAFKKAVNRVAPINAAGRWPANVIHDGSEEVIGAFASAGDRTSGSRAAGIRKGLGFGSNAQGDGGPALTGDSGSAARFFYSAKADSEDRVASCTACACKWIGARPCRCPHPTEAGQLAPTNGHPTTKPVDLKAYLCRLITPPGGVVLDPFAGSGTTGMACLREGFDCILIEREAVYLADIRHRLAHVGGGDLPLFGGGAA